VRRHLPIATAVFTFGCLGYAFWYQDEDVYEYWKSVERGDVPLPGGGENDDDEDDDDDDEEDEWGEEKK